MRIAASVLCSLIDNCHSLIKEVVDNLHKICCVDGVIANLLTLLLPETDHDQHGDQHDDHDDHDDQHDDDNGHHHDHHCHHHHRSSSSLVCCIGQCVVCCAQCNLWHGSCEVQSGHNPAS